jgi:hypothetical protein
VDNGCENAQSKYQGDDCFNPKQSRSGGSLLTFDWRTARRALEHDPEKLALGLDPMGRNRFSEKIMRNQNLSATNDQSETTSP